MPAGEQPRHSGSSSADACRKTGGRAGARPGGPEGGRRAPGRLRGAGHPANSSSSWLGPAPRHWHLSLQSFPRISRKLAAREAAGASGDPHAGRVWVGTAPRSPASLMPLHLLLPWACLAHRPHPSANAGALHGLPGLGLGLGLGRSRLPTLSTPCSQASLEDKQDGGQDARGQAPEDAKVEEASTCREQPAGGEGADECAPEDEVGRGPCTCGQPPAQPCPFGPACPTSSLQELEPESIKLDDLLEKEARESRCSGGIRRGGCGARFCCGCRSVPQVEPGLRSRPAPSSLGTGPVLCPRAP